MGKPQRRRKVHFGDTHLQRRWRTRSRKRDLDQIDEDLKTKSAELLNQSIDLDTPGFAQFYCLHCAKYFTDDHSMQAHFRTKVHKRRMKALELEPYSIEESERAAGQGNFKKAEKRNIETQPSKEEFAKGKRVVVQKVSEIDTEMKEEDK